MLSERDNQLLTETGPGTPMGELMRQYWIPAAKSSELVADGDPVRLMLLGEKLIAFRDSSGRVGVMDHRCPHRCASLFFGRNEEHGIRCVYHGWKFDVDGTCLDMANVPAHQDFKHKVRAKAYRAAERNGLVWVFMGDQADIPPLPDFEATMLPETEANIWFAQREHNWLQALEGDMDTSHLGFLHYGAVGARDFDRGQAQYFTAGNRTPELVTEETEWGLMYGAIRDGGDGRVSLRVSQFAFPFWTMPPINALEMNYIARAWVPMDDTHHMLVHVVRKDCDPLSRTLLAGRVAGARVGFDYLPDTTGWYGRHRLRQNRANDFEIDRLKQRTELFTGIEGITLQDHAVTDSMGDIADRPLEHLTPADRAISQTRRVLIHAAGAFAERGERPVSARDPGVFATVRGGQIVGSDVSDWTTLYRDTVAASPFRLGQVEAAE